MLCVSSNGAHDFLAFVTLRGTMLRADMELTMLSMSTLTGATGAPYGRLRVDPDRFLPFHCGLVGGCEVGCASFDCDDVVADAVLREAVAGGLTEVAWVETVDVVSLLPLLSRLLAR